MIAMPGDQIVLASFGKRVLDLTDLIRQLVNQSGGILITLAKSLHQASAVHP